MSKKVTVIGSYNVGLFLKGPRLPEIGETLIADKFWEGPGGKGSNQALAASIPETGGDPMTPYDVYVNGKTIQIPKWQGWAKGAKAKLDAMMTEEAA